MTDVNDTIDRSRFEAHETYTEPTEAEMLTENLNELSALLGDDTLVQDIPPTPAVEESTETQYEEVSVNTPSVTNEPPPVAVVAQPTVAEETASPTPSVEVKEETKNEKTDEVPPLEVEIAEEAKRAKEEGTTVESVNTLRDAMKPVAEALNKPTNSKLKGILSSLDSVDVNNIVIADANSVDPLLLHTQVELSKAVVPDPISPVIALKSGYRADMMALTNNDKIQLRQINGSIGDQTTKLLRIIHSKIKDTSIGKLSYQKFLQVTAEEDFDTLMFGIFSATYPDATEYSMRCPHCQTELKMNINPRHLIEIIDREKTSNYVKEVIEGYERGEEFIKNSLVNSTIRKLLPTSKAIVEVITPTLQRTLHNYNLSERSKIYSSEMITLIKSVSRILVPDIKLFESTGQVRYLPITDPAEMLGYIDSLSREDMIEIRKVISARLRANRVEYRLPTVNCPNQNCSKEIKNVAVDLTDLLFFAIVGEVVASQ